MKKLIMALILISTSISQAYDHVQAEAYFAKAFQKMDAKVKQDCSGNEKCIEQVYKKLLDVKIPSAQAKNQQLWQIRYAKNLESFEARTMLAITQSDEILISLAQIRDLHLRDASPELTRDHRISVARALFQIALTTRDLKAP